MWPVAHTSSFQANAKKGRSVWNVACVHMAAWCTSGLVGWEITALMEMGSTGIQRIKPATSAQHANLQVLIFLTLWMYTISGPAPPQGHSPDSLASSRRQCRWPPQPASPHTPPACQGWGSQKRTRWWERWIQCKNVCQTLPRCGLHLWLMPSPWLIVSNYPTSRWVFPGPRLCLPFVLLTAVPSTLSYPTPGLLMDIPHPSKLVRNFMVSNSNMRYYKIQILPS